MPTRISLAALLMTAVALPAHAQHGGGHPAPAPQARGDTYRGQGTEPFWSIEIDSRTMRFEVAGRRAVEVARPRPIVGINGTRYQTRQMTVDITHVACSDGMSDRRYPDTVIVQTGRTSWRGCGGEPMREAADTSIIDGSWRIESIADRALRGGNAQLRFDRGQLTGNSGCNALRGTARMTRGRLQAGPIASTRRACAPALMQQERALLAILGQPLSVTTNRAGKLVMTARDGSRLVLSPLAPAPRPRR